MTHLAAIGSDAFTLGFRLAGIRKVWLADTPEDLEHAIAAARRDPEVSILVMDTRDVGRLDPRTRSDIVSSVKPTLVAVGREEDNTLRNKIKQAVGVDLW